ncbi:TonB-dependent receptor [Acinetobacter larvae]|uniref:TonB-dependent receptor n=1 Tax=Acinetobacter larvae TaxID=1789224 RepID=A0A1B2LZ32_9GAMM|nr:TonB-dependent siderophore receptor [Acinetobacter larvae]AOA58159.1 TonB-dependent receptor [Acinetobacter larvae]
MKNNSFSRLSTALWALGYCGSFSLYNMTVHAAVAQDLSQLETIVLTAEPNHSSDDQTTVQLSGFAQQNIAEIPASIQRISAERLADQQAKTLSDVVKNDAAVGEGYAPIGYYGNFMMRGFALNLGSSYLLNGHLLRGEQNVALENKQQVEILKGISAMQSGMSTPGGVVNYVTKRPQDIRSIAASGDSRGGYRIATDLGGFFGEEQQFGYRLNVAQEEMHPYVDHANGKRTFAALAFDWNISTASTLMFDIESQRQRQRSVPGYQLLDGSQVPQNVSWDRLLGYQSWSNAITNRSLNSSLKYSHQINDDWESYLAASYSRVVVDDYSAFPWGCYSSICQSTGLGNSFDQHGNYDLYDFRSPDDRYQSTQFKTGLKGTFATAAWQHHLNMELSASRKRHSQYEGANTLIGTGNIAQDSVTYLPADDVSVGRHYTSLKSQQTALNLLDQIDFNPAWSVLLGGKLLHLNESAYLAGGEKSRSTDLHRFLPQGAVLYQPWQNTHFYLSYAKGLSDGAQAPWYSDNALETLAPLHSTQYELGLKQQWHHLLLTAALFDLKQDHQYNNADNIFVAEGKQHNLGLELGLQGQLSDHLDIATSLALIRSRLTDLSGPEYTGHQSQNMPKVRFTSHLAYQVPQFEGLRLLAGMQYSASKFANKTATAKVSGYTVFDLGAAYQFQAHGLAHQLRFNIDNLFNQKYWRDAGGFLGDDYLFLGSPRTAQLTWSVDF